MKSVGLFGLPPRGAVLALIAALGFGVQCSRNQMRASAQIVGIHAPDSVLVGSIFPVGVIVILPNPCWRTAWLDPIPTSQGYRIDGEIEYQGGICPQYVTSESLTVWLWAWPQSSLILTNTNGSVQETVWVKG